MAWLLLRNLFFTILQPGVVTVLIPYLILRYSGRTFLPEQWTVLNVVGTILMFVGAFILLLCVFRFAAEGKGTLSPLDPTRRLVVRGLYRYTRNPMYVGLMMILIAETIFWRSFPLAVYSGLVFLGLNLFIRLHEEPRLRREFKDEYEEYSRQVKRWL